MLNNVRKQLVRWLDPSTIEEKYSYLDETDRYILGELNSNPEFCIGYGYLESWMHERKQLEQSIKKLRLLGYVEYYRGLLTDDGKAAGSGFCRTYTGNKVVEELSL